MDKLTLELPALYADHHVLAVRQLLAELPGVTAIYASSAFQVVEVTFDPAQIDAERLRMRLGEAGYLEPLPVPAESGRAVYHSDDPNIYFRHTAAYAHTGQTVGFAQQVAQAGRPLWPCPGMGPLKITGEEGE
ncbi:MAG: heavy-metal-associated domain-containing protein [Anaerolineae bacterium]|nr:heavy-metal-associated domain-containing protein [Anaerolineae bacterium]MEB2287403.1 heavy-metal-associated domain-containing protein [Anaerolineae bacterium]